MVDRLELQRRYARAPDEELLHIVFERPADYTEDAIAVASELLVARGVDLDALRRAQVRAAETERAVAGEADAARTAAAERVLALGREPGVCLCCRREPPEQEVRVAAHRQGGAAYTLGDMTVASVERVDLAVPLCPACVRATHATLALHGASFVAWLVLVNALGIGLALVVADVVRGSIDGRIVFAAALGFTALAIALPVWARRREARRHGRLHPLAAELERAGFELVPVEQAGSDPVELYAALLANLDPNKRAFAERQLCALNRSSTVARMRALLDHPEAGVHAVRVLLSLRATEAHADLRRLARDGHGDVQEEARAALQALTPERPEAPPPKQDRRTPDP